MYRDDLAATHARLEQIQRELSDAQAGQVQDKQRIAALTAQLAATQQALQRLGAAAPRMGYANFIMAPRSGTILTLGILSLVLCSLLGPVAWSMGTEELRRIDSGHVDPMTRGSVSAGRICGIVATCLMIVSVVLVVGILATAGNHHSRW